MKISLELPDTTEELRVSINLPAYDDKCFFMTSKTVTPKDGQEIEYATLGLLGGEWSVHTNGKPEYDAAVLRRRDEGAGNG